MKDTLASRFTGGGFVAAALMFWLGRFFLPVRSGMYFDPDMFGQIRDSLHFWARMCRIHPCGMIVSLAHTFPPGTVPG